MLIEYLKTENKNVLKIEKKNFKFKKKRDKNLIKNNTCN